ncbi:MAG: N-acetylglucosamine repressor [Candidatus Atribacteria bacterium]|nr:N-acetylglucosamine repressor [Candidatus Atribacteria bacterium]
MKIANLKSLKDLNKKAILNLVRYQGPLSRAEIANITELSATTVSSVVREFIEEGVLEEIGEGVSRGGRKPVLLRFNPNSFWVIGVEIEGNFIAAALMNLDLAIVKKIKKNLPDSSEFGVIREVASLVKGLTRSSANEEVLGIGIAITGLVEEGVVKRSVNLGWKNVPLRDLLEREIPDIPIYVDNIGKVGVLGEKHAGNGLKKENFIYVRVGTGISANFIFGGQLYRGSKGYAGEFGHMTLEPEGPLCHCGNRGCLEALASGWAIAERMKKIALSDKKCKIWEIVENETAITAKTVEEAARAGDEAALQIYREAGYYLGVGIANLVHLYNPELIVVGGGVSRAEELLMKPLLESLQSRLLDELKDSVRVVPTILGDDENLIGAGALVVEKVLQ